MKTSTSFKIILTALMLIAISKTSHSQNIIDVVAVEGGTFTMGCDSSQYQDEYPARKVTVAPFYISQYEISFDNYLEYTKIAGHAKPQGKPGMPITNISWQQAILFCNWLSSRENLDYAYDITRDEKAHIFEVTCNFEANGYRLPTEAEWEYAAMGGHKSKNFKYSGSNYPYKVAWFNENSKGKTHKSGELTPNELGVYDMSGNVAEFCWDCYKNYPNPNDTSKIVIKSDMKCRRVYRGGSSQNKAEHINTKRRFNINETERSKNLGIRVVRTKTN